MKVRENPSLRSLNTFGLDATARLLLEIETEEDLLTAPALDPDRDLVLGGGSNVVLVDDVPGTIFLNRIRGIEAVGEDGDDCFVEAGAGEDWHGLVNWSLDHGLGGLENLSLIPGSVGAAPIQNIGAYGVELESVLESVTCWNWRDGGWVVFGRDACRFGYRDSRFKQKPDRYLVTSVRLRLRRSFEPVLSYAGLAEELERTGITRPTARDVSDAVIHLRRRKLPDPAIEGNAGSFFKNPVVDAAVADALLGRHPGLPVWPQPDGRRKLSAAWLIEHCGLKGTTVGGAAVSKRHALVLVNRGGATGRDVATLAAQVQDVVNDRFGILLEPEPRLVRFGA
ncbi:MAG: UDP-N-acetylmuramate dehydrogenase [Xanthomonadales bacterium]